MQDCCGLIRGSASILLAVWNFACAGEKRGQYGGAAGRTDLEKVCHFVGAAFLCFQWFTAKITRHGVSLVLVIGEQWVVKWVAQTLLSVLLH
jgi:hypothetical protein